MCECGVRVNERDHLCGRCVPQGGLCVSSWRDKPDEALLLFLRSTERGPPRKEVGSQV